MCCPELAVSFVHVYLGFEYLIQACFIDQLKVGLCVTSICKTIELK